MAFGDALSITGMLRRVLSGIVSAARGVSDEAWSSASSTAMAHTRLVMGNNPTKTFAQVFNRPDVVQATTIPFMQAVDTTLEQIEDARSRAWEAAAEHAADQVEMVTGSRPPLPDVPPPGAVEARARADVVALRADLRDRIQQIHDETIAAGGTMGQVWDRVEQELANRRRRAGMAIEAAALRAGSTAMQHTYTAAGATHVVWVTRFRNNNPCATCVALHGTVVRIGESFPSDATMAGGGKAPNTWMGLNGPPRHPNCRCTLAPWVPSLRDQRDDGPTPTTMRSFAVRWWRRLFGQGAA